MVILFNKKKKKTELNNYYNFDFKIHLNSKLSNQYFDKNFYKYRELRVIFSNISKYTHKFVEANIFDFNTKHIKWYYNQVWDICNQFLINYKLNGTIYISGWYKSFKNDKFEELDYNKHYNLSEKVYLSGVVIYTN